MLVPMSLERDGLSAREAVDAVLRGKTSMVWNGPTLRGAGRLCPGADA
jgi:hypothetical protein